jgi:hypothetical protein
MVSVNAQLMWLRIHTATAAGTYVFTITDRIMLHLVQQQPVSH